MRPSCPFGALLQEPLERAQLLLLVGEDRNGDVLHHVVHAVAGRHERAVVPDGPSSASITPPFTLATSVLSAGGCCVACETVPDHPIAEPAGEAIGASARRAATSRPGAARPDRAGVAPRLG